MSELKPCPCCGSVELSGDTELLIGCENCGCYTPLSVWNHRPAENRIKAQGAAEIVKIASEVYGVDLADELDEYANKLEGEAFPKGKLAGPDRYHKSGGK